MRLKLVPGSDLEVATPKEVDDIVKSHKYVPPRVTHIRKSVVLAGLGATEYVHAEVYRVPFAFRFHLRRCDFTTNLSIQDGPVTDAVPIGAAFWIGYTRSNNALAPGGQNVTAFAQPEFAGAYQIPGSESWSAVQGPYLQNGEVLGVVAYGLAVGTSLSLLIQGILEPAEDR